MSTGMDSPVSDHRPHRQTAVKVAVSAISLLLLIVAIASLEPLNRAAEINAYLTRLVSGLPQPQGDEVAAAARWGLLAAVLVILGAVASLLYLYNRRRWDWYIAVAASLIAIAICSILAIQGSHLLATNPARGDFAGLANLGMGVFHIILPGAVAIVSGTNVVCLLALRRHPSN